MAGRNMLEERRRENLRTAGRIVEKFLESGIAQELIRGASNIATSAVQAGGTSPMMASGAVILGAGLGNRVGLWDKPTKLMAQGAGVAYIGSNITNELAGTIAGIFGTPGTKPGVADAVQIQYSIPQSSVAIPQKSQLQDQQVFEAEFEKVRSERGFRTGAEDQILIEAAKGALAKEAVTGTVKTAARGGTVVAPKASFLPTIAVFDFLDTLAGGKKPPGRVQ